MNQNLIDSIVIFNYLSVHCVHILNTPGCSFLTAHWSKKKLSLPRTLLAIHSIKSSSIYTHTSPLPFVPFQSHIPNLPPIPPPPCAPSLTTPPQSFHQSLHHFSLLHHALHFPLLLCHTSYKSTHHSSTHTTGTSFNSQLCRPTFMNILLCLLQSVSTNLALYSQSINFVPYHFQLWTCSSLFPPPFSSSPPWHALQYVLHIDSPLNATHILSDIQSHSVGFNCSCSPTHV